MKRGANNRDEGGFSESYSPRSPKKREKSNTQISSFAIAPSKPIQNLGKRKKSVKRKGK